MLTHLDLFAGIGGFSMGFERNGIATVAYVEKDKNAQNVLRYHNPNALFFGDIKDVGKHNLPYADIITFGSPCQDLSVAGKRDGLKGEKSGLFWEGIRVIKELRPTFAIWENVPGAYTSNAGRDFATVLGAFHECGARDIGWATLDAQYFGVAQRRRRCFVVADFGGERVGEILFISESSGRDIEQGFTQRESTPHTARSGIESYRKVSHGEYTADQTGSTLAARDYKSATDLYPNTNGYKTQPSVRK